MSKKSKKVEVKTPTLKYGYLCPACTNVAIETSNKMIGPKIDCQKCGKLITLDDKDRYKEL